MNIFRNIWRTVLVFFGLRRKSRPVATLTGFYGFNFNDGPAPKLDRVNRPDAARMQ